VEISFPDKKGNLEMNYLLHAIEDFLIASLNEDSDCRF